MDARRALQRLNRVVDWDWRPAPKAPSPPHTVYAVYRHENARTMAELLAGATAAHLWALDEPAPSLSGFTRGQGPGGKFDLLNQLLEAHPAAPHHYVVISDDDYVFTRRHLADLVGYQAAYGFGLAQPAHSMDSRNDHHITKVRPRLTARRTRFVEIGPVFSVAPDAVGVLPFPGDAGMGWGMEATWATTPGLTLGIIDSVTVRHPGRIGVAYDMAEASEGHERRLAAAGIEHLTDIMRTEASFWRVPSR